MSKITVLPELIAVRRRPAMYVGGIGRRGLAHLVWEVIGNVVDLHLQRAATALDVTLAWPWITVRDDGPGIPVEAMRIAGKKLSALEFVMMHLHTGGTFDGHFPHVHLTPDLRGSGLAVVNALSARMEIETTRDGIRWAQAFERGERATPLRNLGATSIPGTTIRFQPDPEIFPAATLGPKDLRARLQSLAWLQPLLRVTFQGQRLPGLGGPTAWVRELARKVGPLTALYSANTTVDRVTVDLALGWCDGQATRLRSFVNLGQTREGTHVDGMWQGLQRWAALLGASDDPRRVRRRLGAGLVGVIHVELLDPSFGHPTREHLTSLEAAVAVRTVLERETELSGIRDQLRARLA